MSLRSSTRRGLAFARKQKKYKIESDSDEDNDDETEAESGNHRFGGVLATLKNDKSLRNQRNLSDDKETLKNKIMTSPPLQKLSKERGKTLVDENGRSAPPKSIIMTRSAMRAISPLTTQKPRHRGRKIAVQNISTEERSRADSFASDDDDDDATRHQTLSNVEEKSKSRSSISDSENSEHNDDGEEDYEDSYEDSESESSSEFEFGVDDEEFIPDEEDEEDDESASISEFIVDDVTEEISHESVSNNTAAEKRDGIDDDAVFKDSCNAKSDDSNSDTSNNDDANSDGEEDTYGGIESTSYDVDGSHTHDLPTVKSDDYSDNDDEDIEMAEETPTKTGLPRRTLEFDSPEPQMAIIVDDDEDCDDDGDILLATIIDSDTVDGDTIVLSFHEDEEIDAENNETISAQETVQSKPPSEVNSGCNRQMNDYLTMDNVSKARGQFEVQSLSLSSVERHNSQDKKNSNTEEIDKQVDSSETANIVPLLSSKKTTKIQICSRYRQEGEVKRGKWALGAKIGVGSFGQVYVGMNTKTGVLMAVKKFRMEGAIMQDIRTEIELMRSLKHNNIVRYLGAQMDNEFLHIFQEWIPGGSVSNLLSKFGSFSIEVIQSYISQTLSGLSYLHENDIMHRDIKGSNILVDDEGVVKLADFGASKKLKNLSANMMMSLTVRGTPYFMAPEVFEEKYSAKADIWGVGCVVFQMVTATPPWKESGFTNPISLFNHIKKQKGSPTMEHPQKERFSKRQQFLWAILKEFACRCFEQDPSNRPSAKELLDDPFVSRISEGHIDDVDDESTHYRGLFSPGNETNKYSSPKQNSLQANQPSSGYHSTRTKYCDEREMTWMSPPCPKKNIKTPSKQPKTQNSPSPDTREWPVWAKHQLERERDCKHNHRSENIETSRDNISELMDSLALSEDSSRIGQKQLAERRSCTIDGSTVNSNLVGLVLLESANGNPTK